ncbi:MAG: FG-GAP-like repeat-containing protein [Phycisphaerae bacterium]
MTAVRAIARVTAGTLLLAAAVAPGQTTDITFIDATASSGLVFDGPIPGGAAGPQSWLGTGPAVDDYDGDGDLDVLFLAPFGHDNILYRNNGDKTFTDVTSGSGIAETGDSHMALFLDLDNDGDRDLVVANGAQSFGGPPAGVFRNDGGTFTDVTDASGVTPQGRIVGGMAATDYNADGFVDLYFTFWDTDDPAPYNYLYRGDGDLTFTDVTDDVGLREPNTQVDSWAPVFLDVDDDGDQDLFTAVDFYNNYLYILDTDAPGAPVFLDQSLELNVLHDGDNPTGNDMGVAVGDLDGDGDLDIFTTNLTNPPEGGGIHNALFINHMPDPFTDEALERNVWQSYWGWGAVLFDVDTDGDLDLATVGGRGSASSGTAGPWSDRPSQLYVNDGNGFFTDVAAQAGTDHTGDSRGLVAFDYDRDGDDDLLIVNVAQPAVLLENTTTTTNHYLTLQLAGQSRTRDAIGAKLRVTTGDTTQVREVVAGTSFLSSLPWEQRFGVADATLVDAVAVTWPGGDTQTIVNVPVDQVLPLEEGAAPDPVVADLTLEGPTTVSDSTTIAYTATAACPCHYTIGGDVTAQAQWSAAPPEYATFEAPGVLVVHDVVGSQTLDITATLGSVTTALTIVIRDSPLPPPPPPSDTTPPVVHIATPTTDATFTTTDDTIELAGTAADNYAVVQVTWQSDAGDQGTCNGTATWTSGAIPMTPGDNVITITAADAAGNLGTAVLGVTYTPPPAPAVSSGTIDFGSDLTDAALTVWNTGGGTLAYTLDADQPWLGVDPTGGTSTGPGDPVTHTLSVDRTGLAPAEQMTAHVTLLVTDAAAPSIIVTAHAAVSPPADETPADAAPSPDAPGGGDHTAGGASDPPATAPSSDAATPSDAETPSDAAAPSGDTQGAPPARPRGVCGAVGWLSACWLLAGLGLFKRMRIAP